MADLPNSDRHDQLFDQWIFVALYQLGLVPFLSLALSYALLFFVFIGLANKKSINREYTICFFTLYLVCVSFVHGAAPIERLFSPIFYTTLAFCFSALFARQEPKEAVSTK